MYDKIIINGIDYTNESIISNGSYIEAGSVKYIDTIETNKTASFVMVQVGNYEKFEKDMKVEIYRSNNKVFGGFIWNIQSEINAALGVRTITFNCVGNEYIAKKATPVAKAYTHAYTPTIKDMITDIYNTKLAIEGINIGLIEGEELEITDFTFNYLSPADCFDLIAERANMIWYVDQNKNLFFIHRNTMTADFSLNWNDKVINYETLKVNRINDKYRNVQYAVGGELITSTIEEIQYGDGSKSSFTMPYKLAELPKVFVKIGAGVFEEKTVGLKRDVLTGYDWFYEIGSETITKESNTIALATSDQIKVQFKGLFEAVVITRRDDEILKKKISTGTSGIVANVEKVDRRGLGEIRRLNKDRLDAYTINSYDIEFETFRGGLKAGMTISGNIIEEEGIEEDLLISEIEARQQGNTMTYLVKAVYGPLNGNWTDFYLKQTERKYEEKITGSEINSVTSVHQYTKDWIQTETPNLFSTELIIPFTVSGYFGFDGFKRVRYLAWYDAADVELGRAEIALEDTSVTNEINTIAFIPEGFSAQIRYLGWIIGQSATKTLNTGIIIDKQAVVLDKTENDVYQIEKTDYKTW